MKTRLENHILDLLELFKESKIKESLEYSLVAPGKRIRPLLMLALIEDFGIDSYNGLDSAVALEMIHCYSLVHDDLPAMDNDDLRRGRLTNHKKFDEATAILAGDALLTNAFEIVAASNIKDDKKVKIIKILSQRSGINGMILGQALDMQFESDKSVTFEGLCDMYSLKTGCLISAALEIACVISEREQFLNTARKLGNQIGIAFQIQDDILDATKSSEEIGKSASDAINHKATAVEFLSLEEATRYVETMYQSIQENLKELNLSGHKVESLINYLIYREI